MTISTRTFSFALLAGCALLLLGTMLANVIIDPQYVFRLGIVEAHPNPNERYRRFLEYQRDARRVDGLLFSTSRGTAFDMPATAKLMGLDAVASFAVPAGAMPDHFPFLQHVLRDKAAHGEKVRKVLLLLDPDFFGTRPWTNSNLDSFLPPEISGESKLRFWLRYLLALQFKGWRESLVAAGWIGKPKTSLLDKIVEPLLDRVRSRKLRRTRPRNVTRPPAGRGSPATARAHEAVAKAVSRGTDGRLERFIRPVQPESTASSSPSPSIPSPAPTRRSYVGPATWTTRSSQINQLTDVWDFSAPEWPRERSLALDRPVAFQERDRRLDAAADVLEQSAAGGNSAAFRSRTTK